MNASHKTGPLNGGKNTSQENRPLEEPGQTPLVLCEQGQHGGHQTQSQEGTSGAHAPIPEKSLYDLISQKVGQCHLLQGTAITSRSRLSSIHQNRLANPKPLVQSQRAHPFAQHLVGSQLEMIHPRAAWEERMSPRTAREAKRSPTLIITKLQWGAITEEVEGERRNS